MTKSTITRERLEKIKSWRETYGAGSNVMLPAEEAAELARIALDAMGSEPVAYMWDSERKDIDAPGFYQPEHLFFAESNVRQWGGKVIPLYRHAQPAVDSEFIPKNLDKALGVLGMAIPESREEFNFQTERWIQRLIDRVIRYADEFQEQPAPVAPLPDVVSVLLNHLEDVLPDDAFNLIDVKAWNAVSMLTCPDACRAAMLRAEPVTTANKLGNSPVIPDTWIPVSERMPSSQEWVIVFAKWANQQVLCWDDVANRWTDFEDRSYFPDMFSHWMPLPAPPQEVKGE